jgi:hypothetical protein
MNEANNEQYEMGCKICNALEGGICSNFCIMGTAEQKAFMQKNKHLFRDAD